MGLAALGTAARADAISDNLNVIRMSPPLAYYTPGTIARGYLDRDTYRRTGEKLLKVNLVRCKAPFDEDGFEQSLEGASFASHSGTSFGLSAGWASVLNASVKRDAVESVTLTFTGKIFEFPETKLDQLRTKCLGSKNPKGDTNRYQFQIVRLAVGRFEYTINYKTDVSAGLKGTLVRKLALEVGGSGGISKEGTLVLPQGAMAFPLWREEW